MSVVQLTRRQVRASVLAKCRESRRWLKSEIARPSKMSPEASAPQTRPVTITGRWSRSQPVIQNLPGSLASDLSWAFERRDFSAIWARLLTKSF